MNIKKHLGWIIPAIIVVIIIFWGIGGYNGMVSLDEGVQNKWADVETQYQRRADLIPNLVNTVKGYAAHESQTLENVVKARSEASSVKVDPQNITPEKLAEYQKAQSGVSSALGRLMVIVEKYPDLKANQNFLELQSQLEGTENRINTARRDFNEAAKGFNTEIRRFPKNILAGMFGFEKKAYFEAEKGAEKAPEVQF
ncbi:LemA family protein [Prevotella sp. P2-180]|nr:LemA family protein [Prevotella sp. P2-180]